MSQLIKSALVSTVFLFFSASFCLGQAGDKLDAIADSILFKNTNVYYDMSTGEEHRTMMWRDILVLKNGGHTKKTITIQILPSLTWVWLKNRQSLSVCMMTIGG